MQVTADVTVDAPINTVFDVFSDIAGAEKRIKGITKIEILSDEQSGKGLRWRETRVMFGKTATEEMEMTVFNEPRHYTVEAASHGMKYKSTYDFEPVDGGTKVTMVFGGEPQTLGTKIFGPIMAIIFKSSTRKALKKDMTDLKAHIEGEAND